MTTPLLAATHEGKYSAGTACSTLCATLSVAPLCQIPVTARACFNYSVELSGRVRCDINGRRRSL